MPYTQSGLSQYLEMVSTNKLRRVPPKAGKFDQAGYTNIRGIFCFLKCSPDPPHRKLWDLIFANKYPL